MSITVRKAAREDAPEFIRLITALAEFESLAPPDAAARERLVRHGWPDDGGKPRYTAWLVEVSEEGASKAAGYAITFETYSSFLAQPTLYLEDIFVLPEYRGMSAGSNLIRRLIQEAVDTDCGRMEWVVLDWNVNAQGFYQRLGATHMTEWQHYRLGREAMPAALKPSNSDPT